MKIRVMIEMLQNYEKIFPEADIGASDCQGFGCMGGIVSGIELREVATTEWDHRAKKPMHKTVHQIVGVD